MPTRIRHLQRSGAYKSQVSPAYWPQRRDIVGQVVSATRNKKRFSAGQAESRQARHEQTDNAVSLEGARA